MSVLIIETKWTQENFVGDGYVHCLYHGDSMMCPNSPNCIYYLYAVFGIAIISQENWNIV